MDNFEWGKRTADIIRMKAAELMAFADQIESAKTLEELHEKGLEAMEYPKCKCSEAKTRFEQAMHHSKTNPIDWGTMAQEFNRIMGDKNYGNP